MIRRALGVLLAVVFVMSPAYATDLSTSSSLKVELGIRFGDGAKASFTLNGAPLRTEPERAQMTCPPPPQSCAGMLTIFSLAAAASLVFLYAMSKNRD